MCVGLDALMVERATLAAACTAETGHAEVEMEHSAVALGELIGMVGAEELHFGVGGSCSRHEFGSHEEHTLIAVGESGPANLFAVGVALRTGVVGKHILDAAGVAANELTGEAVVVVFLRTTAVVGEFAELVGELHHVAETGEDNIRIVGGYNGVEFYRTVGEHCPNLVGGKLEVVRTEGLGIALVDGVGATRVTVAAYHASAVGSLRDYGE